MLENIKELDTMCQPLRALKQRAFWLAFQIKRVQHPRFTFNEKTQF